MKRRDIDIASFAVFFSSCGIFTFGVRCIEALMRGSNLQVDSVILPDGEQYKTVEVVQKIWDKAMECRLNRQSTFVALGGGVIGDMTGFAAASFLRGVHFLQV